MILHSTNGKSPKASFAEGIANGLAPDGGLYMPDTLPRLPQAFFKNIAEMSLKEIAYVISNTLFGEILSSSSIKKIVDESLNFSIPLRQIRDNIYVLELFNGPTLSFKDVGARFMAHLLPVLVSQGSGHREIILASSGDSGGAVANAFQRASSTTVNVLFPRGELTTQQISQFATLRNVRAIEVDGSFDECQALVKEALLNDAISRGGKLTSGNSINLARELPSMVYFFHAYAQAINIHGTDAKVVISIPCGNLGSFCAALMAKKMGLPVKRFIAANNANDVFVEFLKTGGFTPQKALITLARAMDVGNPSNIARIIDLYGGNLSLLRHDVEGYSYSDEEIASTMKETWNAHSYHIDPQGATALRAVNRHVNADEIGIALASAHPAKNAAIVNKVTGAAPIMPRELETEFNRQMKIIKIPATPSALHRIINN